MDASRKDIHMLLIQVNWPPLERESERVLNCNEELK